MNKKRGHPFLDTLFLFDNIYTISLFWVMKITNVFVINVQEILAFKVI